MEESKAPPKNIAKNTIRISKDKELISERRQERSCKESGIRPRSFYDEPDYEVIAEYEDRISNLMAPDFPGYVQRWISINKERGAHLYRMLNQNGWAIRHPDTVPNTAGYNTQKWGEYDAIIAGNELILCYMRKDIYENKQERKAQKQAEITHDRTGFGQDLYGATRSLRSERGENYSVINERTSKSETILNKQPF